MCVNEAVKEVPNRVGSSGGLNFDGTGDGLDYLQGGSTLMPRLTFDMVNATMSMNGQCRGDYGPAGEPALTKKEIGAMVGKIVKDLGKVFDEDGEEFHDAMWNGTSERGGWPGIYKVLGTLNFFDRKTNGDLLGWFSQWSIIKGKARSYAERRTGRSFMDKVSRGMLKK